MSNVAINWVYNVVTGATPAERAVLLSLADQADAHHTCFPGQATIARRTGYSVRTVKRALATLEGKGLIGRSHRFTHEGRRTSDWYVLSIPEFITVRTTPDHADLRDTVAPSHPEGGEPGATLTTLGATVSPEPKENPKTHVGGLPPDRCPEHVDDPTPPRCGSCKDHRRHRERVERDVAVLAATASSAATRKRAEVIAGCGHCDEWGWTGRNLDVRCAHGPPDTSRASPM